MRGGLVGRRIMNNPCLLGQKHDRLAGGCLVYARADVCNYLLSRRLGIIFLILLFG